jgi:hypothetical protein
MDDRNHIGDTATALFSICWNSAPAFWVSECCPLYSFSVALRGGTLYRHCSVLFI